MPKLLVMGGTKLGNLTLAQREAGSSGGLLGQQARERAEVRFAAPVVAAQYRAVYELC